MDRRDFVKGIAGAGALAMASGAFAKTDGSQLKVGMCDWNLPDGTCNPDRFALAAKVGLNGVQVSIGRTPDKIPLRDPEVRKRYLELGKKQNITVCSVAAGSILNSVALATEPQSAVYVIDAIETAAALGADNILMAFFGNGDLRMRDGTGNISEAMRSGESDNAYRLDEKKVLRVVEALRQIAPRAEDLGVALGIENTITARQNLQIIEAIGSPMAKIYYDIGNSTGNGYPVVEEIALMGKENICEVHLKDKGTSNFGSEKSKVDMPACAKAFNKIGYDKWYVIETSGRKGQFEPDTKANVAYARKTFG